MKLLVIIGTRPECIKLSPIINKAHELDIPIYVCATGQHREMLQQCLDVFEIIPDVNLAVMQPNQPLSGLTGRLVSALSDVIDSVNPDAVLIQGDTTTAFAAALAAFYARVPVGHVEAGLRTYNLQSPFPEEGIRQMISRIASWHFAPTKQNASALCNEGIPSTRIFVTGNTVIDALLHALKMVHGGVHKDQLQLPATLMSRLDGDQDLVLITGHRRENFGAGLESVCGAIRQLAERFRNSLFVYPVHLNPSVRVPTHRLLGNMANVVLIDPVNYYSFVYLMDRSRLIISDSGGVQEEAPSLHRPVFVTRENSERMEAVEAGAVKLVGVSRDTIVREVAAALVDPAVYNQMIVKDNPYGDGKAAERILHHVLGEVGIQGRRADAPVRLS